MRTQIEHLELEHIGFALLKQVAAPLHASTTFLSFLPPVHLSEVCARWETAQPTLSANYSIRASRRKSKAHASYVQASNLAKALTVSALAPLSPLDPKRFMNTSAVRMHEDTGERKGQNIGS